MKKDHDLIKKIRALLKESIDRKALLRDYLIAVYLFGSTVKGSEKKRSDIDLAFVFKEEIYKKDPFVVLQETEITAVNMSKVLQKDIDATILNGASLSFAYHTVRNGICIYEGDTTERILYEVTLDNKYQDFVPFIKELRDIKRKTLIGRD